MAFSYILKRNYEIVVFNFNIVRINKKEATTW